MMMMMMAIEEEHHEWIRQFDEPAEYRGDKDSTNAKPTDFLFVFLNVDFWDLIKQIHSPALRQ